MTANQSIPDRYQEIEPCEYCHSVLGGMIRWKKNKTGDRWRFDCDKCSNGGFVDDK